MMWTSTRMRRALRRAIPMFAAVSLIAAVASPARADVLYDQTGGAATGLVTSEQFILDGLSDCGTPAADLQICSAADDFTVPPGPGWEINQVSVLGQGGAGDGLSLQLLQDSGGFPSLPNSPSGGPSLGSVTQAGFADNFDFSLGARGAGPFVPPGTYWLSVVAAGPSGSGPIPTQGTIPWFWRSVSPQAGLGAAWLSDGCSSGWQRLATCGKPGPDLAFRISGEPFTTDFTLDPPRHQRGSKRILVTAHFPGFGNVAITDASGAHPASQTLGKNGLIKSKVQNISKLPNLNLELTIGPGSKAKKLLNQGKVVRATAAITYTRVTANGSHLPVTKTVAVKFRKGGHKKA